MCADDSDNLLIDIHDKDKIMPSKFLEIGTSAKKALGSFSELPGTENDQMEGFLKSCSAFYIKSTGYKEMS